MRRRFRFRREQRIRSRRAFAGIFADRCAVGNDHLVCYVASNGLGHARLGISAGKRVGNAVVRNREKRRLREAFRLSQYELPALDMIVVIKRPAGPGSDYADSLLTLAKRAARKLARIQATDRARAEGR